jgi:hypothetical protein
MAKLSATNLVVYDIPLRSNTYYHETETEGKGRKLRPRNDVRAMERRADKEIHYIYQTGNLQHFIEARSVLLFLLQSKVGQENSHLGAGRKLSPEFSRGF